MSDAEIFFNQLTNETSNVKKGKMFGAPCMKMPNGKSVAMFLNDNIVVKLKGALLEKALSLEGSKLFEPMEGRPMKEWVQISFNHKEKWKEFVESSINSIG